MAKQVKIRLWDNREVNVQEAIIFAEKDQYRKVFYKVQGRCGNQCFMIGYSYDSEKAIQLHNEVVRKILVAQTEVLIGA